MILDQLTIETFSNYTGRVDVEQISNELAMHWLKTMERTDESGSFIPTDIPVTGIRDHLEEATGYRLKYIGKPYCAEESTVCLHPIILEQGTGSACSDSGMDQYYKIQWVKLSFNF